MSFHFPKRKAEKLHGSFPSFLYTFCKKTFNLPKFWLLFSEVEQLQTGIFGHHYLLERNYDIEFFSLC